MKTMTIGDLKTHFSEVIQDVKAGEEIVAYLVPTSARKHRKRKLGILEGKGMVEFASDFKMTENEFLGA